MKTTKVICYVVGVILLLTALLGMFTPSSIRADDTQPLVKITSQYPVLSGPAPTTFSYDVNLEYTGANDKKTFNLALKGPTDYAYAIQSSYGGGTNIGAIELDPKKGYADTIKITASPLRGGPKPGDYTMTLEVTSGTLRYTFDLKATVTEKFALSVSTPDGLLNTNVTAGNDNFVKFIVQNTGNSPLEKIKFRQNIRGMPTGWKVTFKPENLDALAPDAKQEVEVTIKPSEKTIAGDYELNLAVETEKLNASDSMSLRVTVLTPTIWGWLGVVIVVLVVAALIFMFIKFGRR